MATITELRAALFAWVDGETTLTTIWVPANAPKPARPYVSIELQPPEDVARDWHSPPDNSGISTIYSDRQVLVEIRVLGDIQPRGAAIAESFCEQIKRSLQMRQVVDTLNAADVAVLEALPTQDLSKIDRTDFQSVYMFQARFGVTMERTEDVGFIATSEAPTGTYD
jgi:hypothetical protein